MRLRVLTLNVKPNEGDPHRQQVLNVELRRLRPDLVALQEVLPPAHGESGQSGALLGQVRHRCELLGAHTGETGSTSRDDDRTVLMLLVPTLACRKFMIAGVSGSWSSLATVSAMR